MSGINTSLSGFDRIDTRIDAYTESKPPTHEEHAAPFTPKTKNTSGSDSRAAASPAKQNQSTPARKTESMKPAPERKTSQSRRDNADTRSQERASSRSDTVTEQAVHAKDGGGGQQDKGGGGGGGNSSAAAVQSAVVANAGLDISVLIDELAPMCANDGVFELILPDGERLGVAVSEGSSHVGLLLSPRSNKLAERLRKRQRELKEGLEQRMGRDVTITVL